ncbi:MAG: hypothetical protein GY862_27520, partial [Gammaproteobacteria bacterium]|nr:hypothetical protein [Gammaproteobacteria bacterium]
FISFFASQNEGDIRSFELPDSATKSSKKIITSAKYIFLVYSKTQVELDAEGCMESDFINRLTAAYSEKEALIARIHEIKTETSEIIEINIVSIGSENAAIKSFLLLQTGEKPQWKNINTDINENGFQVKEGFHIVLPVNHHAEEALRYLRGYLKWYSPDLEALVLNSIGLKSERGIYYGEGVVEEILESPVIKNLTKELENLEEKPKEKPDGKNIGSFSLIAWMLAVVLILQLVMFGDRFVYPRKFESASDEKEASALIVTGEIKDIKGSLEKLEKNLSEKLSQLKNIGKDAQKKIDAIKTDLDSEDVPSDLLEPGKQEIQSPEKAIKNLIDVLLRVNEKDERLKKLWESHFAAMILEKVTDSKDKNWEKVLGTEAFFYGVTKLWLLNTNINLDGLAKKADGKLHKSIKSSAFFKSVEEASSTKEALEMADLCPLHNKTDFIMLAVLACKTEWNSVFYKGAFGKNKKFKKSEKVGIPEVVDKNRKLLSKRLFFQCGKEHFKCDTSHAPKLLVPGLVKLAKILEKAYGTDSP